MLLLAVDTSGKNGSLALVRTTPLQPKAGWNGAPTPSDYPTPSKGGLEWGAQSTFHVLELVPLAARMYSAQIIPQLQNALWRQNLKKTDIDAYVVASGPGSFTGLRVGLSTVKGLSEVLQKPIAAVSVLEAAARMAAAKGEVIVALDAGRKQVFVGEYEFEGSAVKRRDESLLAYERFFPALRSSEAQAYSPDQAVRDAAASQNVSVVDIAAPQADIFAQIGYHKLIAGDSTAAEVLEANYIRASDAELFSLPKLMP